MSFELLYTGSDPSYLEGITAFIDLWNSGEQQFTVYSSGSTGAPKAIQLSRDQLASSARRTIRYFNLNPGDTALMALSPATIGGKMMIVRAVVGRLRLIVADPSSNPLKNNEHFIDFLPLVPLQLETILETDPGSPGRVKTILLGGSPLNESQEKRFSQIAPEVFTGFGMTETVSHIAMRRAGEKSYKALEGVTFRTNGDHLVISDELLELEQLETNDAVKLISEAEFEWLGRTDFTINSGGIKIHPEELEKILGEVIDVPFIISSRKSDTFGQECILIAQSDEEMISLEHIQEICKRTAGQYSFPKAVFYSEIIRTPNGKVDRNATLLNLLEK